uniref:Uncharacterized protein LOC101242705 n=1 Tax=Phallusia mammillata TaxID=59560 RepID=A0A6F9DJ99_9ASCI|nr:uncharacterized protein LOC101242705 [Phallusia mammillata]
MENVQQSTYTLVPLNDETPPPAYQASTSTNTDEALEEENKNNDNAPPLTNKLPSYEQATTLPTYEDTQRLKEDEARAEIINYFFGTENDNEIYVDGFAVGSDCTFILAFIMAFFFNWLGFFIGYCILLSLAGRYGAISGFGLSIINWLMYLKYSHVHNEYFNDEKLFMWWFFFLLGSLLIVKGVVNWFKVRRVLSLTPEERENGRVLVLY